MIRNAVIHIQGEQPLLADLYSMPSSDDVTLVCTNVRMLDGKKPIFVDRSDSVFVFPYLQIRFLEVMAVEASGLPALPAGDASDDVAPLPASQNGTDPEPEADLELDEDFLRRIREV